MKTILMSAIVIFTINNSNIMAQESPKQIEKKANKELKHEKKEQKEIKKDFEKDHKSAHKQAKTSKEKMKISRNEVKETK